MPCFLDERRLLYGPWQAFERDVARLLLANGFDDVRLVGGTGDHGGDVLGVWKGELWVFQCKHTTTGPPPRAAIGEVVEAAKYYSAQRMVVATSRPPGDAFNDEKHRYERTGLKIQVADPRTLLDMAARSPEYPRSRRQLRPYQEDVSNQFRNGLLDTGRAQIVLATGLGKTVVMAEVVADLLRDERVEEGRVLVLAHTKPLVDQLHRAFWFQLPKWVPTHQLSDGEVLSFWDGITFATVQSVRAKLDELPHFGLILVDEAHHVGTETYREVVRRLRPRMLGGVTATPWRGDGYDIDVLLGPALVQIGVAEGLRNGFLSEVDYRLLADNIDWEFVQQRSRNSYSLSQLNRRLILPTRDEEAARIVKQVFDDERRRAGIVFSPTILHAEQFAAQLRRYGFKAEAISSQTDSRRQDLLMSRFRAGQLQFVTTVDLFNEGVDVPDVDLLIFLRTTHSRRIFVQQLGRGLRTSPGKTKVVVLDFVTDLRRIAEVVELDRAARCGDVESLGLGPRIIQFHDASAGNFLTEWMLDQADLLLRQGDAQLELPDLEFPRPPPPGGVQ
ncbi:MAG TPA: DNA helicase [Planctomycetales bacterium]|nr:DNA helicase [Planctomycetales bacterium]